MGEWRYSFTILDLEINWRLVFRFTTRIHWPAGWVGLKVHPDTVEENQNI
jgi:hypothetical protein